MTDEHDERPDEAVDDGPGPDDESWKEQLLLTSTGGERKCAANVVTILTNDPRWAGVLAFDAFANEVVTRGRPPWGDDDAPAENVAGPWTDEDTIRTGVWLSREYDLDVGQDMALSAVSVVARRRVVHPVRDYLRGLTWDGEARIDRWLVDCCGADDTPYVRAVAAKFLIGAVARVERPGCKVDSLPILEGEQGIGKSTALRTLAGDAWFLDSMENLGSKDSRQQMHRKWIVELAELDALSRAEVSKTKAFVSCQTDNYRPSYGRGARDYPRQLVFAGSVNPDGAGYLKDASGARRFWPVVVRTVDAARITRERDQLWAEALARFDAGEAWYFDDAKLRTAHALEAERVYQRDPWEEQVFGWLYDVSSPKRRTDGVTTGEVLHGALRIEAGKMTRADETRVGTVMRRLKWSVRQLRQDGERVRLYRPASHDQIRAVTTDGDATTALSRPNAQPPAVEDVTASGPQNPGRSSPLSLLSQPDLSLEGRERNKHRPHVQSASPEIPDLGVTGRDVVTAPRRTRSEARALRHPAPLDSPPAGPANGSNAAARGAGGERPGRSGAR